MPARSPDGLIQAVDRAVRLLKQIASGPGPVALAEAADGAAVNRSTAWRLLATLEHHGLVERDEQQRYVVGIAALRIAAASDRRTLAWPARALLERLVAETGETAGLSVPDHLTIVTIDQVDSPQMVSVNWVGRRLPLHCSSNGKVLLASLPAEELESFLARPLERLTPRTITDPEALRAELELVRRRGYGLTVEELEDGLHGASAAARDVRGYPLAFLSVSGPAFRIGEPRLRAVGELLVDAAAELERSVA
jgi:DNA-binding IclR family transcriptional regulator